MQQIPFRLNKTSTMRIAPSWFLAIIVIILVNTIFYSVFLRTPKKASNCLFAVANVESTRLSIVAKKLPLHEQAIHLVIDAGIFELQADFRGISNVWYGQQFYFVTFCNRLNLIPEFAKLLTPPSKMTILQRSILMGRDLKKIFSTWQDYNIVAQKSPQQPISEVVAQLDMQDRLVYIASYYDMAPNKCNVLMAYDCIPENFGMPMQPGQHYWGRVEGIALFRVLI